MDFLSLCPNDIVCEILSYLTNIDTIKILLLASKNYQNILKYHLTEIYSSSEKYINIRFIIKFINLTLLRNIVITIDQLNLLSLYPSNLNNLNV